MKEKLTPMQVWQDFETTVLPDIKSKPAEIRKAQQTARKTGIAGKGNLGADRIRRIVEKYAPGRYEFHYEYFTLK